MCSLLYNAFSNVLIDVALILVTFKTENDEFSSLGSFVE